ncbi:MAG: endo-1,4-beta-xylanase [Phycisphaerales bacterium]|nr:endo-1,4-beta-xylanase [Planctomycetota bacterium]
MFSFAVFDAAGLPRESFELRGEHLIGNDDMPAQAEIRFEGGLVRCTKAGPEAAGICLMVDVPAPPPTPPSPGIPALPTPSQGLGQMMLRTCFLPKREDPYLLSLELARHRIMIALCKLEEWGMFELSPDHPAMVQLESARLKFGEALVADRGAAAGPVVPGKPSSRAWADKLAWEALAIAVDASEKLTVMHAAREIPRRLSGALFEEAKARYTKLIGDPPPAGQHVVVPGMGTAVVPGLPQVGIAVSPAQFSEPLQKAAAGADFVHMPVRWNDLEPVEGKLSFATTDRWIEWAVRTAKLPVTAGPILDLRALCLPEWLYIWENDYETMRDMVVEHITQVVTRYRRTVTRWTVCSGLHVNSNVKLSYEQIMDLTKVCILLTKKIHPQGKIAVEIQEPFGEYFANDRKSLPPTFYAESVLNLGLGVDALALRVQVGAPVSGQTVRDLMSLSALVDRYAAMERPLHITAVGAPSAAQAAAQPKSGTAPGDDDDQVVIPAREFSAGRWRGAWSEAIQADWAAAVLSMLASKPSVQSICWQELADASGPRLPEMQFGGLFQSSGTPKAAGQKFLHLVAALREKKAPAL